jgi:hypothetical protein
MQQVEVTNIPKIVRLSTNLINLLKMIDVIYGLKANYEKTHI